MLKYLIVDDDPASRTLLEDFLSPYGQCDLAANGEEAIERFRLALQSGKPYELVCLDIMMPCTDGHQVLRTLRQLENAHHIFGSDCAKVIMITALSNSKHCIQAFDEGCESYITKPIQEQRLLMEVQALLGELPRPVGPPHDESPASAAPAAAAGAQAALPCPGRYLIVDDDRLCRELLRDMLSSYGRCDFAYDGQEAVDAVRLALEDGTPYDLVCLDIMMPGIDGHQALEAIRKLEAERGIYGLDGVKVIMTTALRDSKHCMRAFNEGCEAYVTKPIEEAALLSRMCELGLLTAVPQT